MLASSLANDVVVDFSISAIASSLIFSSVGFYVFREGRKQAEIKITLMGIALMTFSYFTSGPWADWGIGLSLCAVTYQMLRS